MDKIIIWAPLAFGAMIGWLSVYFIRKYKTYNENNLLKTAGMYLTGAGINSLPFIKDEIIGASCILYYMLGCSIGFFIHLTYQVAISFYVTKGHKSLREYALLSSCNLPADESFAEIELLGKADAINKAYKMFDKKKITEQEFVENIKRHIATAEEYSSIREKGYIDDEPIIFIEGKEIDKSFSCN